MNSTGSYVNAGKEKKKSRRTVSKGAGAELLEEMGMGCGRDSWKRTTCVVVSVRCVPECKSKTRISVLCCTRHIYIVMCAGTVMCKMPEIRPGVNKFEC